MVGVWWVVVDMEGVECGVVEWEDGGGIVVVDVG